MTLLQAFPFAIVFLICIVAVFYRHYHDNTLQRAGLIVLAIASIGRLAAIIDGTHVPAVELAAAYGAAVYLLGTAVKVVRHRLKARAATA